MTDSKGAIYFIAEDKTSYYADSVEWCPFDHLSDYFLCGTYQLEEETSKNDTQVRCGNVVLYRLILKNDILQPTGQLSIADCIPTSGILDMKWCPQLLYNKILIAFACSDGHLLLKCIDEDAENAVKLNDLLHYNLAEETEKIVLSVDWTVQNENTASIIASDTKGTVNLFQLREADLSLLNSWKAHNFESWISSFNYSDPNIIYSGGDDCCFKGWDVRCLSTPIFINKCHTMGVTAIAKSKLNENLLVSGSYDERIILFDNRNVTSPLSDISVGGGVWRLKWHPTNSNYLLAAAMHNGFHVLSLNNNELHLDLSYEKHESLAYGVDWSHIAEKTKGTSFLQNYCNNIIASCSFYDNLLNIWGIKI